MVRVCIARLFGGAPLRGRRSSRRRIGMLLLLGMLVGCAGRGKKEKESSRRSAERYYEIGVASFHNGMLQDAKVQLRKSLGFDAKFAPAHYLQGLIDLREGVRMVDALTVEMCLEDESAKRSRLRADALHREARAAFERAVKVADAQDPVLGRAYNSMAVISAYFENYERSVQEAQKAAKSDGYTERYSALGNLGWAYLQGGDPVQALTELRQALLINPDFCVARYRLARAYLAVSQPEQAKREIDAVLENPRCPIQDAHRVLGQAYLRMGQRDEARTAFLACVAAAPQSCLARDCSARLRPLPKSDSVAR